MLYRIANIYGRAIISGVNSRRTGPDASTNLVLAAVVAVLTLGEPFLFDLWRSSGFSLAQARVLRAVARGHASAGALAQAVSLPASSLSRILERLEERGLVVRRVDARDRRRILIETTDAGRTVLQSLPSFLQTELVRRVDAMSEEERQAFLRGVEALTRETAAGGHGPGVRSGAVTEQEAVADGPGPADEGAERHRV